MTSADEEIVVIGLAEPDDGESDRPGGVEVLVEYGPSDEQIEDGRPPASSLGGHPDAPDIDDIETCVVFCGEETDSGSITFHKYLKSLVPSTFAARYSSFGICMNVCLSRYM